MRRSCALSGPFLELSHLDTNRTPVAQAVAEQFDPILSDFRNFVFKLWKHLGLREPTGIQYDIAQFLQYGPRRRIIQAFRGVGKSWITAAFVLWRLCRNPNERILVISANEERAAQFTTFCRRLIEEAPFLNHLRPRKGARDSTLAFDVAGSMPHQSPSLRAAGITGQITGGRASLIVPDDVEVPKNSLTQTMRDRLSEAVKEFDAILMSTSDLEQLSLPPGEIVFLGTPQTEMTIYAQLEPRGYTARIWPARFPNPAMQELYGGRLAPTLKDMLKAKPELGTNCAGRGEPTEPLRFPDLDLMEREASYGRSGFALQFMLNPSMADQDRYPLKLSDLMVMDVAGGMVPIKAVWGSSPELTRTDLPVVGLTGDRWYRPMWYSKDHFAGFTGSIMAIDPSGRGKDELGYAIVSMNNGYLYLLRCKGLRGGYTDENLQLLANEAKTFNVNEVIVESNFGDGMFSKLLSPFLQRTHPVHMEEVRSTGQKELRIIDVLEPVMNQHRLVIDAQVIKDDQENYNKYTEELAPRYQLFYQMTRITKERGALAQDDRLDAVAICVARWVEMMDKDVERNEAEAKERLKDLAIQQFLEQAGGANHQTPSTLDEFFGYGGDEYGN